MKEKNAVEKEVKYVKPVVETYEDIPVAGGCGDRSESSCKNMAYWKQGPGCGDRSESSCKNMAYWV